MDREAKRHLKRLGKEIVEQRSKDLQRRLQEANPAPSGSDAWAKNYREATLKERQLRVAPPNRLSAEQVQADFVLNPVWQNLLGEPLVGVPGYFLECLTCGDLLHTRPAGRVACRYGTLWLDPGQVVYLSAGQRSRVRLVTLIGKADNGKA